MAAASNNAIVQFILLIRPDGKGEQLPVLRRDRFEFRRVLFQLMSLVLLRHLEDGQLELRSNRAERSIACIQTQILRMFFIWFWTQHRNRLLIVYPGCTE